MMYINKTLQARSVHTHTDKETKCGDDDDDDDDDDVLETGDIMGC